MTKTLAKRNNTTAAQLGFFEVHDETKTNMVALYDLAPKFVFYAKGETVGKKVITREFNTPDGARFKVTIKPTLIQQPDGSAKECYLGEREQIVEEVIRRLASNRNRLSLHGDGKTQVRFTFSLNEVRKELKRVHHSFRLDEIREAITLLNEVRIKIEALDGKRQPLLSAAAFPSIGMRKLRDGDKSEDRESFVDFNPLVAEAIRTLRFQQVSYDLLMAIKDPVSRWLVKRLWLQTDATDDAVHQITASEIRSHSGMTEWKANRNMLRRMRTAVEILTDMNVLSSIDEQGQKVGRRCDDLIFTMTASNWFLGQVQQSRKLADDNLADLRRLNGGEAPDGFVTVSGTDYHKIRERTKRKSAAVACAPLQIAADSGLFSGMHQGAPVN